MARRLIGTVVNFSPFITILHCPQELAANVSDWYQALKDLDRMRFIRLLEVNGRAAQVCLRKDFEAARRGKKEESDA